ncbi:glycosyltransferase [Limosilactobacillus reuteri]|uniref:glycosyltransferase n=1 Tax=Limosilactobacillus reuteri TaxID=1598 RepID=UPI002AAB199D|nr:glycosyltransferase [Limosilactobacillus reuteri]WPU44138.1 glycosyltransferase [Limosilactobacillus reuteri]
MKVTIVVPSLRKTGVTEVIKQLLIRNHEEKNPIDFSLIVLRDDFKANSTIFRSLVSEIHILTGHNLITFDKISEFKKIILKISPQVIHFHGFNAELYIPFVKKNNIIVTAHNMGIGDFKYSYGYFIGLIMSIIQKQNYKYVNKIVGVSKAVTNYYKKLGFKNVKTIENGVEIPKRIIVNKKMLNLKKPVGIYVGNIDARKNTSMLLDVFSKEKDFGTLVVVGDNPKSVKKFNLIKNKYKRRNIIFVGRVSNVYPFLCGANYFISASKNEGLPMAAIEAMGVGLDLILSDIPQHRELKQNENNRIYFFKNDENGLRELLVKYVEKFPCSYGKLKNKESFLKRFTASVMFEKYLKLYYQFN